MKKVTAMAVVIIYALFLSACSTVLNTTTQDVEIKSTPPNGKITIDGKKFGITPQKVNLERGVNHVVKIELDGFEAYETQLTRKISAWFWFNIFNGILPGVLTDMFTGSMYNLLPENLDVELQPVKIVEPPTKKR